MTTDAKTAAKCRPILFSAPMVRAILAGEKTMTRRVVKLTDPSQTYACHDDDGWATSADHYGDWDRDPCPYGKPGDELWVKETFARRGDVDPAADPEKARHYCRYRAEYEGGPRDDWRAYAPGWRSGRFMHRCLSRVTLRVTEVRVERLQEISIEDVFAEGFEAVTDGPHANEYWREETGAKFVDLWNKLNGKTHPWESNPWVWVVAFERVKP